MATNTIPTNEEMLSLEGIIDRTGLFAFLTAISILCGDKADHIRVNWQDADLAREWDRAAKVVEKAALADVIGRLSA